MCVDASGMLRRPPAPAVRMSISIGSEEKASKLTGSQSRLETAVVGHHPPPRRTRRKWRAPTSARRRSARFDAFIGWSRSAIDGGDPERSERVDGGPAPNPSWSGVLAQPILPT